MQLRSRRRRTPPSLIKVEVGTPQCEVPDDATVLAEAKTMYTRLHGGDWLLLLHEERWIGASNWHCMYFNNWNTALCEAVWLAMGDDRRRRNAVTSIGFPSEAAFVAEVARQLQDDGWHCHQEVRTQYGRIDFTGRT